MHVVLWDTRRNDVAKDFAGGMGVGMYPGGGGWKGRIVRYFYKRDHRPVALNFAYLAAIFKQLGHKVEYAEDRDVSGADLYVFNPSLLTIPMERAAMKKALAQSHKPKVLVVGQVAYTMPQAFTDLDVKIVRGEPEKLLWELGEVLEEPKQIVDVGSVQDLDTLPWPDWSPFNPGKFRIAYDFWKFPTGLIQQSRGCTLTCNYCPYILVENKVRLRDPERVVEEMRSGMQRYGFRSFKFRDPLFGVDRKKVFKLIECIAKLPRKVQFSIESRLDLMKADVLRELKKVGLTSITVGIETPNEETLRRYKRAPIKDDKQRDFVILCRRLGIRTVAGFMIGFPEDTVDSIKYVLNYAAKVNPTYANFNVVTPYPGTEFYEQVKNDIADHDVTKYNVYTPVMKYKNLTAEEVQHWHSFCFTKYYFRSKYVRANAHLLWPKLQWLGIGAENPDAVVPPKAEVAAPSREAAKVSTGAKLELGSKVPASDGAHAGPPKPKHALPVITRDDKHSHV